MKKSLHTYTVIIPQLCPLFLGHRFCFFARTSCDSNNCNTYDNYTRREQIFTTNHFKNNIKNRQEYRSLFNNNILLKTQIVQVIRPLISKNNVLEMRLEFRVAFL